MADKNNLTKSRGLGQNQKWGLGVKKNVKALGLDREVWAFDKDDWMYEKVIPEWLEKGKISLNILYPRSKNILVHITNQTFWSKYSETKTHISCLEVKSKKIGIIISVMYSLIA